MPTWVNDLIAVIAPLGAEGEALIADLISALKATGDVSLIVSGVRGFLQSQANTPVYNVYPDNAE